MLLKIEQTMGHSERMQLSSVFSDISKFSPYIILPHSL